MASHDHLCTNYPIEHCKAEPRDASGALTTWRAAIPPPVARVFYNLADPTKFVDIPIIYRATGGSVTTNPTANPNGEMSIVTTCKPPDEAVKFSTIIKWPVASVSYTQVAGDLADMGFGGIVVHVALLVGPGRGHGGGHGGGHGRGKTGGKTGGKKGGKKRQRKT